MKKFKPTPRFVLFVFMTGLFCCWSYPSSSSTLKGRVLSFHASNSYHEDRQSFTRKKILEARKIALEEWQGNQNRTHRRYQLDDENFSQLPCDENIFNLHQKRKIKWLNLKTFLSRVFLPVGYPHSVPEEYGTFQKYNLIQDLCSYLRNIMATHAIFISIGVGKKDSHVLAATLQWILRDGISMAVGLLFTSFQSQQFGVNVKKWRLFADLINNVGITFDMIAPYFSNRHLFFVIISLGSICKCLCGIAAGATNAAIFQYFSSRNNNVADILSKNHAQHTMVSLIGLLLTILLTKYLSSVETLISSPNIITSSLTQIMKSVFPRRTSSENYSSLFAQNALTWIIYGFLTAVHMLCNYRAVKSLALNSFNPCRYSLLTDTFFQYLDANNLEMDSSKILIKLQAAKEHFSPKSIALKEPVLLNLTRFWQILPNPRALPIEVRQGRSLKEEHTYYGPGFGAVLNKSINLYHNQKYFILLFQSQSKKKVASVFFLTDSTLYDRGKALFEVELLRRSLPSLNSTIIDFQAVIHDKTNQIFPLYWKFMLDQGWLESEDQLQPEQCYSLTMTF